MAEARGPEGIALAGAKGCVGVAWLASGIATLEEAMIDIVMLVQNRPRLANQAIQSLLLNTTEPWRLTIVDDGSGAVTEVLLRSWTKRDDRIHVIRREVAQGPGPARNLGIGESQQKWSGRGDWLYLCDSDCWFGPGWDQTLTEAYGHGEPFKFRVLAGYCHPYNQTNSVVALGAMGFGIELHEKYAVGLLSWMMKWETWDQFGPYEPAPVANFSEDWAMCHKIRLAGFRVGCIHPPVVVNCGLTGSSGKLSPGSELLYQQTIPEGVVIE